MEMLQQIQSDILDEGVPISAILRKAKVLAAQLKSEELQRWASLELDGYAETSDLPDYRVIITSTSGTWTSGFQRVTNRAVQMSMIKDEDLKRILSTYYVMDGVRRVEELAKGLGDRKALLSPDIVGLVNDHVREGTFGYSTLHNTINSDDFRQVLDTVRNRLLDFILKVDVQWKVEESPPPQEDISRLIEITIYNQPVGGPMTVFDQRGQHVEYQFNAAGDINIESATNLEELSDQLSKLRSEIAAARDANVIPDDTAVEAEFYVLQAAKQVMADQPDKPSVLDHIGQAKALLEDLKAAAGLVGALVTAAEIVGRLL